jgi:seryl-tRNA synthetase
MLSKKQLRNDIKVIEVALKKRNFSFDASALSALEDRRKKNQIETQDFLKAHCQMQSICPYNLS